MREYISCYFCSETLMCGKNDFFCKDQLFFQVVNTTTVDDSYVISCCSRCTLRELSPIRSIIYGMLDELPVVSRNKCCFCSCLLDNTPKHYKAGNLTLVSKLTMPIYDKFAYFCQDCFELNLKL